MHTPDFGIAFPQSFWTRSGAADRVNAFLQSVEEAGLHSIWVQEQLLGKDPSLEPVTTLGFAAAATSRVRLATATVVGPLRDPILLAKSVATLDRLSEGRVILGLSVGEVEQIYQAVGVPMRGRGRRLDEILDVILALWQSDDVDHSGSNWSFRGADMQPKPVQDPHPPVWFGGKSTAALRRACSRGSGWIGAGGSSVDDFAAGAKSVETELERLGRSRSDFTIAKKVYLAVDEDGAAAKSGLEDWFAQHWPPSFDPKRMATEVGIAGDIDAVGEAIDRLLTVGVDLIILNPVFDEDKQLDRLLDLVSQYSAPGDV